MCSPDEYRAKRQGRARGAYALGQQIRKALEEAEPRTKAASVKSGRGTSVIISAFAFVVSARRSSKSL